MSSICRWMSCAACCPVRLPTGSDLGGSALPIAVEVPSPDGEASVTAFAAARAGRTRPGRRTQAARRCHGRCGADAGHAGARAGEPAQPGVLALIVDGYDPYRDAVADSPLRVERWVRAADAATADQVASRLQLDGRCRDFDPVGVLATGDYIPRAARGLGGGGGRPSAIFDAPGMRDLLRAADLTVVLNGRRADGLQDPRRRASARSCCRGQRPRSMRWPAPVST